MSQSLCIHSIIHQNHANNVILDIDSDINTAVHAILLIKTHDSESRGQEEAGRTQRTSELFTGSTTMKLVNALNKPPLQLSLSYQGLSMF